MIKDARGNSFFSDTEAFFNNAGTAQPLVCAVTAIKPMAAAKLHRSVVSIGNHHTFTVYVKGI